MIEVSAAALLAFSVSTAGSHLPSAAEASSQASYSTVYLPPQAVELSWSRRNCMAFTMVWVWVREEPVIGRDDTIFNVPMAAGAAVAAGAEVIAGAEVGVAAGAQAPIARLATMSTASKVSKRLFIILLLQIFW